MSFGLDKCRTLTIDRGNVITQRFEMQDGGFVEDMANGEFYKYLGMLQSHRLQHNKIKDMAMIEYVKRANSILRSKLNGKNTFKALNTYAIPVLTYTFGLIKWTATDLENILRKTRTILTKFRGHHPKSAVERLTLPRLKGGRGLIDVVRLHEKQIVKLKLYFRSKQSPLHRAVTMADRAYTPLNLAQAETGNVLTDVEHQKQKLGVWLGKALHGRHPNELGQGFVDQEASNKWLTQADIFLETEGSMLAIQDQVVATKNYRKYILKEGIVNDKCRRYLQASETIQHINAGCSPLAPTRYLHQHDQVAAIIHQKLARLLELSDDASPYYTYTPENVLESYGHRLYWNRTILTDKTVPSNQPDITLTDKVAEKTYLIDVAIPNSHHLEANWIEKCNKYQPLVEDIKRVWKQKEVHIVPLVISSTGLIPKRLHHSLALLKLPPETYIQLQKSVILNTTTIVREFLNLPPL